MYLTCREEIEDVDSSVFGSACVDDVSVLVIETLSWFILGSEEDIFSEVATLTTSDSCSLWILVVNLVSSIVSLIDMPVFSVVVLISSEDLALSSVTWLNWISAGFVVFIVGWTVLSSDRALACVSKDVVSFIDTTVLVSNDVSSFRLNELIGFVEEISSLDSIEARVVCFSGLNTVSLVDLETFSCFDTKDNFSEVLLCEDFWIICSANVEAFALVVSGLVSKIIFI